ncbi:MAG: agmatinase [Candidatus Aenigmarchaeota archaeon]|nr:agmatinase [Candidatus Aenigmarchaeota archaeon]
MELKEFADPPQGFSDEKNSRIVVIPVPYDETSTWLKGADKGPDEIITASANMELYDIETRSEVYRQGIFTDEPVDEKSSPEKMTEAVRQKVTGRIKDGKFVVVIGGEHSVSVGAAVAHAQSYPSLSVLQLDAHTDLREEYKGSRHNHACTMARIKEACPIVQVGIRSMEASETKHAEKDRIFYAEDIHGKKDWMKQAADKLSDNVYLTLDLDVFDPSVIPSTGTPEPGGMLWYDVLEFLKMLINEKNLVGFDVVELCPDHNRHSAFTAAKLIYKILSYKFSR